MKIRYLLQTLCSALFTIIAVTSSIAGDLDDGKALLKQKDYVKAYLRLEKAARAGDAEAQFLVGYMNDEGDGTPKNATKAAEWYLKSARQGNASAQNNLGELYQKGRGVKKDPAAAAKWYQAAADQGDAAAQCNLGWLYDIGTGVKKDRAKAIDFYLKSAAQGYATAQYNLGASYLDGQGVKKDEDEALRWFRKAANQDHLTSQENLCALEFRRENWDEAFKWCKTAEAKSQKDIVPFALGIIYLTGKGSQNINNEMAFHYLTISSKNGRPAADYALGTMYDYGFYVKRDIAQAKAYYEKAAAGGVESAKKRLKALD